MIWTLILSFNSSVWLHLTLYIAWEQSNIPQHSSILACWDTLHLPAAIQGAKGWTKAKNIQLSNVFPFALWSQSLIFLGGAASGGEVVKQAPFIPKWFPWLPQFQLGCLELEFAGRGRICFAEGVRWRREGFWGFPGFAPPPSQSPIPAFGPQIKPPSEAALGVRINREGWACVI